MALDVWPLVCLRGETGQVSTGSLKPLILPALLSQLYLHFSSFHDASACNVHSVYTSLIIQWFEKVTNTNLRVAQSHSTRDVKPTPFPCDHIYVCYLTEKKYVHGEFLFVYFTNTHTVYFLIGTSRSSTTSPSFQSQQTAVS